MPGLANAHWKPSGVPEPVQFVVHDASFLPVALIHLPAPPWQSLSLVQ